MLFSLILYRSQVGCRQGCTFCATGREYTLSRDFSSSNVYSRSYNSIYMSFAGMGKLRSLTADEILVQVYYASKVCRVATIIMNSQNGNAISNVLPQIDNIVVSSRWSRSHDHDFLLKMNVTLIALFDSFSSWEWVSLPTIPMRWYPL